MTEKKTKKLPKKAILKDAELFDISNIKFGARPDIPDIRDYSFLRLVQPSVYGVGYPATANVCTVDDTSAYDQLSIGSCTANACTACFEKVNAILDIRMGTTTGLSDKHYDDSNARIPIFRSRLAEYYWARTYTNAQNVDNGVSARDGVRAMADTGMALESTWPYVVANVNVAPPAAATNSAKCCKATDYYRVDVPNASADTIINGVKAAIVDRGLPVIMTFVVYTVHSNGDFLLPAQGEVASGGHAMLIVGYNDTYSMPGATGAFLCKNSWGLTWGCSQPFQPNTKGYAHVSYDHLRIGQSADYWVLRWESQVPTTPVTPIVLPEGGAWSGEGTFDIYEYLTKKHDGQPTPGLHEVVIVVQGASADIDICVRQREYQGGTE